jgi:hypothetical protein
MGTWFSEAPDEFRAWIQNRFDPFDVPQSVEELVKLENAWRHGYNKGKGVVNGNTL